MDAFPRSPRADETRSGGKILRPRRTISARTPYDRPKPSIESSPQRNPNWLSRIVYPPTRLLATGAGKLLSSVFSQESSSSSSSEEDEDVSSGDGIYAENDENDLSSPKAGRLEKDGTSEIVRLIKESQPTMQKSETKRLIEQLVMHETFSREEYVRLINIIKARVVDCPITDTKDGRIRETLNRVDTYDVDMPDPCSTAVREAKKWLEEKKLESISKSDCNLGSGTFSSVMLPHVTEGLLGSPVDVAKSYMRARPPWASPSMSHIELNTPSPEGLQLFKEEASPLLGGNFVSSSKLKKDSLASGSWNILEEIRKVRSKAAEEMLRTPSSRRMDSPSFALESKDSLNVLEADKPKGDLENKNHNSTKITVTSSNVGVTASLAVPDAIPEFASSVLEMAPDGLENDVLPFDRVYSISQPYQDSKAAQIIEENEDLREYSAAGKLQSSEDKKVVFISDDGAEDVDGLMDTNGTDQELCSLRETTKASTVDERNCVISKEVAEVGSASGANGFTPLSSRFSAGLDTEQNSMPLNEEHNPGPNDELLHGTQEPGLQQSLKDKKQTQRKNPSRYSRRGRAQGK